MRVYFTFSPSILFFFKYFGCKFKGLRHIKELRPPNFKIETSLGSIWPVLDCSSLIIQYCSYTFLNTISNFSSMGSIIREGTAVLMSKHYFRPAKFFKFKFLPLVKDCLGEYYSILSHRFVLLVWVGFLAKKFPKTRYEIWHRKGKSGRKGQSYVILYIIPSSKFLLYQILNKKSVEPGSSKILLAANTYPSVELIPLEGILNQQSW